MRGLFIHAVVYAVVNALLVGVWLLTSGSTQTLSSVQDDPVQHVQDGFWPLIVMVAWGGALIIHLAVVIALVPGSGRRRREKERLRRENHRTSRRPPRGRHAPPAMPA